MPKIILTKAGKVLQEIDLVKERLAIGRRPHNDVVIDDIAISGEHAAIRTNFGEVVLEDLNSTNGTQVNGQPIKKHFLQDQDVIELAGYRLRYIGDIRGCDERPRTRTERSATDDNLDLILGSIYPKMWGVTAPRSVKPGFAGAVKLLTGANAGREIGLIKQLTTVGQPGVQVAAFARHAQGYCLSHVEGDVYPLINGQSIGTNFREVSHGDLIEVAGERMRFLSYGAPPR